MNDFVIGVLLLNAALLLLLPRRWAFLPLLFGGCYLTLAQEMTLGPFHFTVIRLLIPVGVARVLLRGERLAGRMNGLDWLMVAWSSWAAFSSFFHTDPGAALVFRLGLVYDACGTFFLLRVFCQTLPDVLRLCRVIALLLAPVAVEMLFEKMTGYNLFSLLGGVPEIPEIRGDRIRAQGPFAHSILAGTVGAVGLPLVAGLWKAHRKEAGIGIAACLIMILACASSGPILSALIAGGGLFLWRWRRHMPLIRWLAVLGYIGLSLVMKAPVYYLLARIDLAGGSTGWHRAALIESAIHHLSEWWLAGTDYTRHWMPTGVAWSGDHTDITNHYLQMGVLGGLPLMLFFIALLVKGFSFVGRTVRQADQADPIFPFLVWALGVSLFAQAVTCISVSYFDQSFIFLYLTLAAIGSARFAMGAEKEPDPGRS